MVNRTHVRSLGRFSWNSASQAIIAGQPLSWSSGLECAFASGVSERQGPPLVTRQSTLSSERVTIIRRLCLAIGV